MVMVMMMMMHALPISSCGLLLDDEAIRIAPRLQLNLDLCHSVSPSTSLCRGVNPGGPEGRARNILLRGPFHYSGLLNNSAV